MDSANDMKAANKTYGSFTNLLKWAVPIIVIIVAAIVIAISG